MSQIKQHLKHFDAQKHNNTNRINICSKDNEIIIPKKKKNQNYSNVPLYVSINIDKMSTNHNIINNQVLNDEHLQTKILEKDKDSKQMNIKKNINDKHNLKYKSDIENIAKNIHRYCLKFCFEH